MQKRITKAIFGVVLLCVIMCIPMLTSHAADKHTYEMKVAYDSLAISNAQASTSDEIHMEYTVKEVYNGADLSKSVGQLGIGTTAAPTSRFPYFGNSGYMNYMNVNMTANQEGHLLVPGATYHIVFYRTSDGMNAKATYKIRGQEKEVIALPHPAGNYEPDYPYVMVYMASHFEAYITDAQCYDKDGKPLGIQVNDPEAEIIHHGGIFDYSDCIGSYYCESNDTLFTLKADNTYSKHVAGAEEVTGKYTIYESYSMVMKENGKEKKYGYFYNHFIDADGNRYTYLKENKVQYVVDDEVINTEVLSKDTGYFISEPKAPEKKGYTFQGWFLGDGTKFDFGQVVSESITLYGRWDEGKAVEYKPVSAESQGVVLTIVMIGICCVAVAATVVISVKMWKGKEHADEKSKDQE